MQTLLFTGKGGVDNSTLAAGTAALAAAAGTGYAPSDPVAAPDRQET